MAEGRSKAVRARQFKERVVLAHLRRLGQSSKQDLAAATGFAAQTVVDIINGLSADGLVRPLGRRLGRVGQPSVLYAIDPDGVYGVGLHVGRGVQELALVDFEGEIRKQLSSEHAPPHFDHVLRFLTSGLKGFSDRKTPPSRISGVGVALSHDLWYRPERKGLPEDILAEWDSRDVAAEFRAAAGLPVFVENDTRVAALAEYLLGGGQDYSNFLYVVIGPHISGALVLGGSLETGAHGNAATLGAIPVGPSRLAHARAASGANEFLGNRASLSGLMRYLRLHGFTIRAVSELPDVLDRARGLVQEWLDDCVAALVEGLTACFAVIDVEAILIDSLLPQFLVMEIVEKVEWRLRNGTPPGLIVPGLKMSTLGSDAALLGSAILPINAYFQPGQEGVNDRTGNALPPRRRASNRRRK
jgi:predicted NBD/HSP70 family sugar kinase